MLKMGSGSMFQADGPATENARSPSLVKLDGIGVCECISRAELWCMNLSSWLVGSRAIAVQMDAAAADDTSPCQLSIYEHAYI